jgi:hypothetical protein
MATLVEHNWNYLAASSHYNLAKEIKYCIQEGEFEEALNGLDELIDSMSKIALREARSHLAIIMLHILKWKYQPEKRSTSWILSILNARDEIEQVQEETPSTTNRKIQDEAWDKAFNTAIRNAVVEMQWSDSQIRKFNPEPLTWQEVFEDEYFLENND